MPATVPPRVVDISHHNSVRDFKWNITSALINTYEPWTTNPNASVGLGSALTRDALSNTVAQLSDTCLG